MTMAETLLDAWQRAEGLYLKSEGSVLGELCKEIYQLAKNDSVFLHEGFNQYFVSGQDRVFISFEGGVIDYFSIVFDLDTQAGFGKILLNNTGHSLMLNGASGAMPKAVAAAKRVCELATKGDWNYEPQVQ